MAFIEYASSMQPMAGRPASLSRNNVDLATLVLTFHYREWVDDGKQWNWEPRQQALEPHKHYRIDKRRGVIEVLADAFWSQLGLWAAGDREEPLLYKGQVKHERGQRVEFVYEHFVPEEVDDPSAVDLQEIDTVASTRLGYDVRRYSSIAKEKPAPSDPWEWEKKPEVIQP